jgi:hypothetical protein
VQLFISLSGLYRARLATLDVDLPPHIAAKRGSVSSKYGMIALLCALFLSKQGAGEAAEAIEEKMSSEVCAQCILQKVPLTLLHCLFMFMVFDLSWILLDNVCF